MARKSRKGVDCPAGAVKEAADEKKVWRCGVYVRLSKYNLGKGDDGGSIENQERLCRNYISEREDLSLAGVYEDNGRRGTSFDRPGLNRLLEDARAGVINCVVVKDLSRFARDYIDTGEHLESIFPFLGVRFIAVTDNFDSLTASADEKMMTVPMRNIVNEMYAKDLSQKICTSIERRMEKGEFLPGKVMYGYIKDPGNPYHLIPDPETADYVRLMFKMRAEGKSYNAIGKKLDEIGAVTPAERKSRIESGQAYHIGKNWRAAVIANMLKSTVYIGNLEYHKAPKAFYRGIRGNKIADKGEWIIKTDMHEPIVSGELFNKVQEVNCREAEKYRKAHSDQPVGENIYLGILKCGDCGANMRRHYGKSYRESSGANRKSLGYSCGKFAYTGGRECTRKSINISVLEQVILDQVRMVSEQFADMLGMWQSPEKKAALQEKIAAVQGRVTELKTKRTRIKKLKEALYMSLQDGLLHEDEYLQLKEKYARELQILDKEISVAGNRLDQIKASEEKVREAAGLFRHHADGTAVTRELLDDIINEIRIYDGHRLEIDFKFKDMVSRYGKLFLEDSDEE